MNRAFREYEFKFHGFNFVSSVDIEHPIYQRIKAMPESMFIQMNLDILENLFIDTPLTAQAIDLILERVNKGGTYAFIELGKNN